MSISKGNRVSKTGTALIILVVLLLTASILSAGCTSGPAKVQQGDTVRVRYTVSTEGGQIFESNMNGTPIEFTVGSGKMIPGFDKGVIGMAPGETKQVTIPPEDAYGPINWTKTALINRTGILANNLSLGQEFNISRNGLTARVYVRDFNQTLVLVDGGNHILAGKTLVFDITLDEILKKPA